MLKSVVLSVLVWHGMCQFSIYADQEVLTGMQKEQTVIYNVNVSQQIVYVNSPLLKRLGFGRNLNNTNNISRRNDYVVFGNAAFKVHRRALPWNKARRICSEEGGHLAVIRSKEEEKFVTKMMTDLIVSDAWVGYHDQFDEGDWISVFDEPLDESGWQRWTKNWTPCPDNYGGKENCARLLRDGSGMDDHGCSRSKMFICKISIL